MPYRKGMGKVQKYIGRIVVLFTPVFVAGAAVLASQAEQLPGHPQLDQTEIVALMVLGAGSAIGAVITWLVNLGKHERTQLGIDREREVDRRIETELDFEDSGPVLEEIVGISAAVGELGNGIGALAERVDAIEDLEAGRSQKILAGIAPASIMVESPHGTHRYVPVPDD